MLAVIGWLVIVIIAALFSFMSVGMFVVSAAFKTGETVVMGVIMGLLGAAFAYGAWVNVPFVVAMKLTSG